MNGSCLPCGNDPDGILFTADKELAAKCNVGGTPTIFINGLKLADRSLDGYRGRINQILSSQGNVVSRAK